MITVNLYYTGVNGKARLFAQEMESSGTAAAIRAENGNIRYGRKYAMLLRRERRGSRAAIRR